MLSSGELDISYFGKILDYALITLRKLSAPAYEDELNKKHHQFMKDLAETYWAGKSSENSHVMALIKGLRFVLEQIKVLIVLQLAFFLEFFPYKEKGILVLSCFLSYDE